MASGKQLSFQYGEVSSSQRFRSDLVSHANGLSKLKNMFVKRSGGVSNRSGFKFIKKHLNQVDIPSKGDDPKIKGFVFWSVEDQAWKTLEYAKRSGGGYAFYVDGVEIVLPAAGDPAWITSPTEPHKVRFTVVKDNIFVTPEIIKQFPTDFYPPDTTETFNAIIDKDYAVNPLGEYLVVASSFTGFISGVAPFLPVSYLVTATFTDGRECVVTNAETTGYTSAWNSTVAPVGNLVHPHSQLSVNLTLTLSGAAPTVKSFQLYRAAGAAGIGSSFYKLAGRSPYNGLATSITFHDYGQDDPSITPPLDSSMYIDGVFRGAKFSSYYQQRLIVGMESGLSDNLKAGDMIASKLGGPFQIKAPIIYSNTGSFQFSIPVNDGTDPVAALSMDRLIIFTEKGVYVVRGGEQGVLTPTTINPLLISDEGCSSTVEPKMAGRRGYFINAAHTKLMGIVFSNDGNLEVFEASLLSDHLLYEGVHTLEVISGEEDTVYLCRRDGKLVRVTCSEEGVHGFSEVETEGYVESIYKGKAQREYVHQFSNDEFDRYYDVLFAYVIKNGFRCVEQLEVRNDKTKEGEFFADSFSRFGWRKARNGTHGWVKISGRFYFTSIYINIPEQTWDSGEITVHVNNVDGDPMPTDLIFYYGEGQQFLMTELTSAGASGDTDYPDAYTASINVEVPEELRDIKAMGLSEEEERYQTSNWCPATTKAYLSAEHAEILKLSEEPLAVSVMADGVVLSSPLNPNKPTFYTQYDSDLSLYYVDLEDYYAYGYIGLPFESEMETLDIETGDNRTLTNSKKLISGIGLGLLETRGGFAGVPDRDIEEMEEFVFREDGDISQVKSNINGYYEPLIPSEWTKHGKVAIKNVDPVPMTVVSIYPKGTAGD